MPTSTSAIGQRTETFDSSPTLFATRLFQEIAATRPQADFGLGDVTDDRKNLLGWHAELASATLDVRHHDVLAIADREGRLLYTSARPDVWDQPIMTVPVIAAAYKHAVPPEVVHASDPQVVASGILAPTDTGLYVLFSRVERDPNSDAPKLAFVRLVPAAELRDDVEVVDDPSALAIVAPDGTAETTVAQSVVASASPSIEEVVSGDDTWLVQRAPLVQGSVGELVLARRADVGLAGLFPRARLVLAVMAIGLAGLAAAGALVARRRDLTRR